MNITPAQLRKTLSIIQTTMKTAKYGIDDYNCTNFALGIFNTLRPNDPIKPTLTHIPNTVNIHGSLTPQGLYMELIRRLKFVAGDRPGIKIASAKVYVGASQSPCK